MDDFDQLIKDAMKNTASMNTKKALSASEKERIMNLTMNKITSEINSGKKEVIRMRKLRKHLPIIIAATIGLGVVSISAATFFRLKMPLAQSVNVTTKEADTIPVAGNDIMSSSTKNGITVKATQVIGDQYGFYVLLELSSPSLSSSNIDFEDTNVQIDGVDTLQWDFSPMSYSDHVAYAVMNIRTPDNLIGKTIDLTLSNLIHDDQTVNANWNLNWNLDYTDVSKEYSVNQMIDIYGGKALFENVYVSPLSVYITMDEKERFSTYGSYDDTITVKLHDGSIITSNSDNTYNDTTVIGVYLGKLTNLSDIESVTFAGIEVPINSQFSVVANGLGKKLIVSQLGNNDTKINQLLEEDANAFLSYIKPEAASQFNMNISYDYQEPNNRLTITYTATNINKNNDPVNYYAISDIDLISASRRNCSKDIDLKMIKQLLKSGQFQIKNDNSNLSMAQKDYITSLSDDILNALFSHINFDEKNGIISYPQSFMLTNEDTLLISIPATHELGDHIELIIMPQ